jgi:outer membrane protein OmpA-like peptidoglycan-associated protein
MYNVTSKLRTNENGLSQWDVIPYVGVGMIHNNDWSSSCSCPKNASDSYPLAFAYGVQLRYRLSNRFHLLGEVSGMTTARNFDAIGTSTRFGDNMLTATLGLSLTIGKSGWKKVVDAKPYMDENILLKDYISQLRDDNIRLKRKLAGDTEVKVLYPKNSYSGLLSLRARLSQNGIEERNNGQDQAIDTLESLQIMDATSNVRIYSDTINIGKGQIGVGVPVYFFFNLNSVELVDKSQLVNLDEIATIAIQQGYDVTISGAADSATGTEAINNNLSKRRADYIVDELVKRGLKKERLHGYSYGGISKYESNEANRFTIVTLTSINH